ncbi:hypothetical protein ACMYSM_18265 [Raoultella planticola]|uniref:hypothetical protein n=1 Tax=Raoultella planticola TaxID=575 RepID=UPI003DA9A189
MSNSRRTRTSRFQYESGKHFFAFCPGYRRSERLSATLCLKSSQEIIRSNTPVGAAGAAEKPGSQQERADESPLLQIAIDAQEESLSIDLKKYNHTD